MLFNKEQFWDESFKVVDTTQRKRGRPPTVINVSFPKAYRKTLPLEKKKYNDLMTMCSGQPPLIPQQYHAFYKSLPSIETQDQAQEDSSDDELSLAAIRSNLLKRKRSRNSK